MRREFLDSIHNSAFGISDHYYEDAPHFHRSGESNKLLWNRNTDSLKLRVDGIEISLPPNHITSVTYFHTLELFEDELPLTAILFNKAFYCPLDHDEEIGCNGILFFGAHDLPIIQLPEDQEIKFSMLWEVLSEEFVQQDNVQGEMLQMLLKRFIILCTRIAKEQLTVKNLSETQIETIRQFNFLVDKHFREKHKVKDYAEMMFKSPKTLSNVFAQYKQKSPQLIIQERIVLEAKRLMQFTDKQTQEIAYELGFEDPAYFSRFFKKIAKVSPSRFLAEKYG